jgi:hypothetical protein
LVRITYSTPRGSVTVDERRGPGTGEWRANRSWKDVTPLAMKRLIREPQDYEVVQYIVENTEYLPDYFPIEQAREWLGSEGVVFAALPKTPLARLMIDWIGSEEGRCYIHLKKYRDPVEALAAAMPTENLVSNENLLMLTSVLENADLPLTAERIDEIRRNLT